MPVLVLVLVGAVGVARAASPREGWQDVQILSGRSTLIGVPSGVAGRGRGANPGAAGIAWTQQLDGAADDSGGAEGAAEADAAEDAAEDDAAQVPAAPVVPVADNYEAATNADDLITKALEHGTLSAAQARRRARPQRRTKRQQMQPPRLLRTRSSCAKTSRQQAPQRLLHSKDRPPSTPPTSASRRPWRTLQRRRATWTGLWRPRLQRRRPVRPVLADAKVMADNAQIAARNLADVSGQGGGGVSGGSSQAGIGQAGIGQADSSLGEKVGIAFFFVLLAIALLIWWFQFGRGGDLSGGLAAGPSTYGAASFGRVGSTA